MAQLYTSKELRDKLDRLHETNQQSFDKVNLTLSSGLLALLGVMFDKIEQNSFVYFLVFAALALLVVSIITNIVGYKHLINSIDASINVLASKGDSQDMNKYANIAKMATQKSRRYTEISSNCLIAAIITFFVVLLANVVISYNREQGVNNGYIEQSINQFNKRSKGGFQRGHSTSHSCTESDFIYESRYNEEYFYRH